MPQREEQFGREEVTYEPNRLIQLFSKLCERPRLGRGALAIASALAVGCYAAAQGFGESRPPRAAHTYERFINGEISCKPGFALKNLGAVSIDGKAGPVIVVGTEKVGARRVSQYSFAVSGHNPIIDPFFALNGDCDGKPVASSWYLGSGVPAFSFNCNTQNRNSVAFPHSPNLPACSPASLQP